MSRTAALSTLCRILRGEDAGDADWLAVVALANAGSVTPAMTTALAGKTGLPDDLSVFLNDVGARNRARNDRLMQQLGEAATVLNSAGIEPVVFKGGALLAVHASYRGSRLLTDLDLLVEPARAWTALEVLEGAGFTVLERCTDEDAHVIAEVARPNDAGLIDLHQRPPGPPGAATIPDLVNHCRRVKTGGGFVLVPSPATLLYLTVLHDQFHDGDFWRGGFDLRHLLDIALLIEMGVDWDHFDRLCASPLIRNAGHAQIAAAARLVGARVPEAITRRILPRLHFRRHRAQFAWPALSPLLALAAAVLEAPNLFAHTKINREGRRRVLQDRVKAGPTEGRIGRLRHIFDTQARPGKV